MNNTEICADRPLISIAIPVLNEAGNILKLYQRLVLLADKLGDEFCFEFIFSDNSSSDNTWDQIDSLALKDDRIKGIRFSKNFGFQKSIWANYLQANGEAVIQIDADLQDPPELIHEFLKCWKEGADVVYGVRVKRKEAFIINQFRRLGYFVINKLSDYPIPENSGDFRLIDRKIIDSLRDTKSVNPYLRGIIAGVGFKQIGIPYERDARTVGSSNINIKNLIRIGLDGVMNHSTVPLRLATYVGFLVLLLSIFGAIYFLALKYLHPDLPEGLASTQILILFGVGLNASFLGLIGEYVLKIYQLMKNEPMVIIRDVINISKLK
jgi:glycosyltransferase involved in cell wall biosynthesis